MQKRFVDFFPFEIAVLVDVAAAEGLRVRTTRALVAHRRTPESPSRVNLPSLLPVLAASTDASHWLAIPLLCTEM